MKSTVSLFLLILAILSLTACSREQMYPYRWLYASSSLRDDGQLEEMKDIVKTASEHKLNGVLLSGGIDQIDMRGPDYLKRLKELDAFCKEKGVEIIPSIFSIGYGGTILAHNRNLAEGLPVKDALYVVKKGEAKLVADPKVGIANGYFEEVKDGKFAGFEYPPDSLGNFVFVDKKVFKDGKTSLRFENFDKIPEDSPGLVQEVKVAPYRSYRLTCWLKTEGMESSKPFGSGNLRLRVVAPDGRPLEYININAPTKGDWFKVSKGFNSISYDKVRISIGPEEAKSGKFWVDSLAIEEVGLVNVLRRPGTPVAVKSDKDGTVYEEGKDYAPIADPNLNFRFNHDGPAIQVLKGSRIKENERLRVSWYHGMTIYDGQVTVCMSEPEIYDIWRNAAKLIKENLNPSMYFLHQDEIRAGGTCEACRQRNLPMAQILGDCVTKATAIIREVNPQAEIFSWSDMLDPNHNASDRRPYYYHVNENYNGSWNYVPKDLIIACWYYEKRKESLAHFSGLGFRTIAGAYYDADDLDNPKGWLEALDVTPGASGIMYTTWLHKYALLAGFGDLISKPRKLIPLPAKK